MNIIPSGVGLIMDRGIPSGIILAEIVDSYVTHQMP